MSRFSTSKLLPFDIAVELSEEEWESFLIGEGGLSEHPEYADSVFSYCDIVERERPEDPSDDDPEDWPVKSRLYKMTRHPRSEVPPFNTPVTMNSAKMSALWIKADGFSDRSDLQDSRFECSFVDLTEDGFIYRVVRLPI